MVYSVYDFMKEKRLLNFENIQQSSGAVANAAYIEKYGVDKSSDPEWAIGGERHTFWLEQFDRRYNSLILNPDQK